MKLLTSQHLSLPAEVPAPLAEVPLGSSQARFLRTSSTPVSVRTHRAAIRTLYINAQVSPQQMLTTWWDDLLLPREIVRLALESQPQAPRFLSQHGGSPALAPTLIYTMASLG
jgi:hypothetical protein